MLIQGGLVTIWDEGVAHEKPDLIRAEVAHVSRCAASSDTVTALIRYVLKNAHPDNPDNPDGQDSPG